MTKAIILAAGMGTRLRPLTNDRPKCLVELAGKPLLEHQISALQSLGIFDIHVVGGYLAKKLERPGISLHINSDFETTNMVYTLFQAEQELGGDEDVIISYGDIVYEESVLEKLLKCEGQVCVVSDRQWLRYWRARFTDPLDDAETFRLDDQGKILELGKKPQTVDEVEGQFIGLMKFRQDVLPDLRNVWSALQQASAPGAAEKLYTTDFLQQLVNEDWELRPVFIENGWAEVDSQEDLAAATDFFTPHN